MIAVLTRTSLLTCALSAVALAAAVDQGEDRHAPRTELGALVQASPKETSPSGASPSEAGPSLQKDPREVKNLYADPAHADTVKQLKEEMYRLKKELKDEDQFEKELPRDNVDAPRPKAKT